MKQISKIKITIFKIEFLDKKMSFDTVCILANLVEKNLRIQLCPTHKSQLISSNSIPHSILDWFFTIIFIGDTFEFLRGLLGDLKDQRAMRRLNWIITQLKIFMAAHHITKEPLSYLSSPNAALLGLLPSFSYIFVTVGENQRKSQAVIFCWVNAAQNAVKNTVAKK